LATANFVGAMALIGIYLASFSLDRGNTMDSFFVWILMCAGAAVALLGLFLLTSERELKSKRREIEQLLTKLENATTSTVVGDPRTETDAELRGEEARNNIAELQAETAALRRTLDASQARVRELEAAQCKVSGLETLEADHRRERQSLLERIAELEGLLSDDQEKLSELQRLHDRLAEADSVCASLQEEIRRQEADIPGWQARLTAAEEIGQRLAELQQPCNELLTRQATLAEGQRRFQEELSAFARLISTAVQPSPALKAASPATVTYSDGNGVANPSQTGINTTQDGLAVESETNELK
jgi:chromosome segregation ATPase